MTARSKMPLGVATVVTATIGALPILAFGELQGRVEGAQGLGLGLLAFGGTWLIPGTLTLRLLSPHPALEGILAGSLVGVLLFAMIVRAVLMAEDWSYWPLFVIFGLPFAALAVGCGAGAGLLARRRGGERSRRVGAIACLVAGLCIVLVFAAFFWPALGALYFAPVIVAVVLIGTGLWGLRRPLQLDVS